MTKNNNNSGMANGKATAMQALSIGSCIIDDHCVGYRWEVNNAEYLARLIAIIAMGQATHAAEIINKLSPAMPAITLEALCEDAKQRLSIKGGSEEAKKALRSHRDGLIFEAISWVAARQGASGEFLLKDPHISATTQGLDGLLIELDEKIQEITKVTIFEDKCSEDPRSIFRDKVLPTFSNYHENRRASELVAAAATLISTRLAGTAATKAAAMVLDLKFRVYRAGLAIQSERDSVVGRAALFKDYESLKNISKDQRIGATFVASGELRDYFNEIAKAAIKYIDSLVEV